MTTSSLALRAEPRTHQCVCRLVFFAGSSEETVDECWGQPGPDQGMCDHCLRDGHHLLGRDEQRAQIGDSA